MLHRLGYTDEDNPYGDKDLARTFIWKQKLERDPTFDPELSSEEQLREKLNEMITSIERLKE